MKLKRLLVFNTTLSLICMVLILAAIGLSCRYDQTVIETTIHLGFQDNVTYTFETFGKAVDNAHYEYVQTNTRWALPWQQRHLFITTVKITQ